MPVRALRFHTTVIAGLLLVIGLLVVAAPPARGQTPAIVGVIVRDSAERPVADAIVTMEGHAQPQARTNLDGRVNFVRVAPGRYRVRAIRAGYLPAETRVEVGAADTTIVLTMTPTATRLEEMMVIARRTGVFGKVARAADWTPLGDAEVTVFGERTLHSDSTGAFGVSDLRPGAYMIRVEREGFVPAMRSVRVPDSGAVEVAFLLDSGRARIQEMLISELNQRQRWRGNDSAVIPAEELTRYDGPTLTGAIRGSRSFNLKGMRIDNSACLYVDGVPKPGWPVDAFDPEQVEAVEVYAGPRSEPTGTLGRKWPRGTPCGAGAPSRGGGGRGQPSRSGQVTMVVIWLKPEARR